MKKLSFLLLFTILFLLLSSSNAYAFQTIVKVGAGFNDVVPRQIIRATDDHVYIFASKVSQSTIVAYWSNSIGVLSSSVTFSSAQVSTGSEFPISVEAVYDGSSIVHVLVNTSAGNLKSYPFDITTKTFRSPTTLTTGLGNSQTDIGTSGLSALFDKLGVLHVAYWSNSNRIVYRSFTYNSSNTYSTVTQATTIDNSGPSNHPSLAISPTDNSVTVAWVSQATTPANILAKTKTQSGTWGAVETVSSQPVWTSPNSGLNIDQGPSLLIDSTGTRHLTYIKDWEDTGGGNFQYGRIQYATRASGSTVWTDKSLSSFSHDPALAITNTNQLYIIGHGFSLNTSCKDPNDICTITKSGSLWANPVTFVTHSGTDSFDASPSVKWSVVGWNRSDIVEFIVFQALGGSYQNTNIFYGSFGNATSTSSPSPTPVPTPTKTPSPTPTASPTPTPCPADINQDKIIDISDYAILASNFLKQPLTNVRADINKDNIVDISDYSILATNFLKACP